MSLQHSALAGMQDEPSYRGEHHPVDAVPPLALSVLLQLIDLVKLGTLVVRLVVR